MQAIDFQLFKKTTISRFTKKEKAQKKFKTTFKEKLLSLKYQVTIESLNKVTKKACK